MTLALSDTMVDELQQEIEKLGLVGSVPRVRFAAVMNYLRERAEGDWCSWEASQAYKDIYEKLSALIRYHNENAKRR